MNMMAVSCGDTTIIIDAGVMFPDPDQPGVDLIVPDLGWLEERRGRIQALVLTHGHEDHIGAVPYVLPYVDGPIYGTPLTLALVERKLLERNIDATDRLVTVNPREPVTVGPFGIEFLRVTHSMPDCVALAIETPLGTLVHTGDYKIDHTPIDGQHVDLARLAELGSHGVLGLFADSTNVDRPGVAGSEVDVRQSFEELFASARGKLVVATFSSSLFRIQILIDLAVQFERQVAFVGRSLVQTVEIAQRLGYLRVPAGLQIRDADVTQFPPRQVLCITTGSQGEPMAALSRIAVNDHRHIRLAEGDTVVFSARAIPGNEKAIARVMSHLARRGADVVTEGTHHIHVSGHACEEEIKLVLALVRPRYFVPIHGEYRQLARHAQLAAQVLSRQERRVQVLLAENGDVIQFDQQGARIAEKAPVGRILIDGTRVGEVGDEVLRDRRHLAGDGLVVAVVAISRHDGALAGTPEITSRGFVFDPGAGPSLLTEAADAISALVEATGVEERVDQGLMNERIRVELRRFFKKRTGRRPLVLPVLMEI